MSQADHQPNNPAAQKKNPRLAILTGGLFLVGLLFLLFFNAVYLLPVKQLNVPNYGNDMGYFWTATRTAILGGNPYNALPGNLYHSIRVEAGGDPNMLDPYKNPHYFTLLFAPFAAFPLAVAATLWLTALEICAGLTVFLVIRLTGQKVSADKIINGLLLIFFCRYSIISLMVGQTALFLLLLMTTSLYFSRNGQPYRAGACAALLLIKPQIVFVILPLLMVAPIGDEGWKNRYTYQRFIGFLLTLGFLLSYSFAFQPGWLGEWFKALFAGDTAYFNNQDINSEMASLRGVASLLVTDAGTIQLVTGLLSLPLWIGLGWLWWRNQNNAAFHPYLIALAVAINVLTSPYARDYDYCLLFFAFLFNFFTLQRLEKEQKRRGLGLSLLLWPVALLPYGLQFAALSGTRAFEIIVPILLLLITWLTWRKAQNSTQLTPSQNATAQS